MTHIHAAVTSHSHLALLCIVMMIHCSFGLQFNATRNNNNIQFEAVIGEPPQRSTLSINSMLPYTWVNESAALLSTGKSYNSAKSKSITISPDIDKIIIIPILQELNVKTSKEQIKFNSNDASSLISSIPLLIITDSLYQLSLTDGGLGLGIPINNKEESLSFISFLQSKSIIKYKIFTIDFYPNNNSNDNDNTIQFSFGDINKEIIDNYKHFALLNPIISLVSIPHLYLIIQNVYVNNTTSKDIYSELHKRKRLFIDYIYKYSYAPISFMIYLEKHLFSELIQEDICAMYVFDNQDYGFICTEINKLKDKSIIVEIGDWKLDLQCGDLFYIEPTGSEYIFGFKSNANNTAWIFGESILKSFTCVFDYEMTQIGLYNINRTEYSGENINDLLIPNSIPIREVKEQQKMLMRLLFIAVSIAILLGTALIGYRFFRRRKLMVNKGDYYSFEH